MKNHRLNFFWSWLPEGWRADFEEQRHQWLLSDCSKHEWRVNNFLALLGILKAVWCELTPVTLQYLKKIDPNFVYEYDLACNNDVAISLEKSFRYDYFIGSLRKLRITSIVAFLTYAVFGYLDVTCLPSTFYISWGLRFIGCLLLLSIYYLTGIVPHPDEIRSLALKPLSYMAFILISRIFKIIISCKIQFLETYFAFISIDFLNPITPIDTLGISQDRI